jgi:uncharacterized membrane protein
MEETMKKLAKDQRVGIGKTIAVVSGLISIYLYTKGIVLYVVQICNKIDENNRWED